MKFSAGSCVRFGWETFKMRPWFFIGVTCAIVLLGWLFGFISGFFDVLLAATAGRLAGYVAGFLSNVALQSLLGMGAVAFFIRAHDDVAAAKLGELWHPKPFWNYVGASIFNTIIGLAGLVLLIVPGVIFSLRLMFAPYLVIDRGRGPLEAIRESWRMSRGHAWRLFALSLALMGIVLLGAVCLLVGLLVAIPVTSLAIVHAYRTLSKMAEGVAA